MSYTAFIRKIFRDTSIITMIAAVVLSVGYVTFEPAVLKAVEDQFTVSQTITSEITFVTTANNVTMSPSIAGITGGSSYGQTQVAVYTNDSAGFTMTITASSSPALQGNTQGGFINDYSSASASIPDFAYSSSTLPAEFGYSVSASTTADLAQKFLDNGSTCNAGASDTNGHQSCWYGLSTVATSTMFRTSETAAPSGATSTIFFRVYVPSNPSPSLPEDTYTATATLTATTN